MMKLGRRLGNAALRADLRGFLRRFHGQLIQLFSLTSYLVPEPEFKYVLLIPPSLEVSRLGLPSLYGIFQ
jgi:hypothetical protein